ncbi:hypothetical protein BIV57_04260 [Mangrovactinospora gilvigrisea]|uniref:Uncharacterized protein n=2 Tax=Mangrovactinospora gilvigrisea TaxID=1428644 RepID=A0A1J7CB07_9ACTN|nr:hypothetical protein BIV57_04260 [Mangrovactinospora gilvigrisea]
MEDGRGSGPKERSVGRFVPPEERGGSGLFGASARTSLFICGAIFTPIGAVLALAGLGGIVAGIRPGHGDVSPAEVAAFGLVLLVFGVAELVIAARFSRSWSAPQAVSLEFAGFALAPGIGFLVGGAPAAAVLVLAGLVLLWGARRR